MRKNSSLTFKQIDAFRAIATLGSFASAAKKLGATQPAISKRIAELENSLGVSLFNRSHRGVELTSKGLALLSMCDDVLLLRERIIKALSEPASFKGDFRFGVTELGALSFLPELVPEIRRAFPEASIHPEVGLSRILLDRLLAGALDLAVLPMRPTGPKIRQIELADVEFAWMCHPEMEIPPRIAAKRLSQYPLLGQTNDSGLQRTINRWLRANGASARFAMTSNSVNVLCSLSAAGLGLSCLPISQFHHHVDSGRLKIVETIPSLPKVTYYIGYKDNAVLPISALVANVIRRIGGL